MGRENITVQIMAGGKSSRMGTDKALVTLGGRSLLDRAIERWQGWSGPLVLSVGGEERRALAPVGVTPVFDRYPGCGPLGGLHGGLAVCETELLLLCAVDTPFLARELADGLVDAIGAADACVYTLEGRPQPLFGLYRGTCLSVAQLLLEQDERRMLRLLDAVNTVFLPAMDGKPFRNLNTPEDVAAAEKVLLRGKQDKTETF